MKNIIIDTNALLRLLLNDIPNQADKIGQLIDQARQQKVNLIVPQIVIFEIEFALRRVYQLTKSKICQHLSIILFNSLLNVETKNLLTTALSFYQHKNISFVDSFLLAKSELDQAEIFTFDQKLGNLQQKLST